MISLQVQGTTEQGFQCKYQSTHCVSPAVAEKDKILQQNSLCTFFPFAPDHAKARNSPKETRLEPGYNIARAHRAMQVASLHRCLHCQSAIATDATVIQCLCLPLLFGLWITSTLVLGQLEVGSRRVARLEVQVRPTGRGATGPEPKIKSRPEVQHKLEDLEANHVRSC
jgi:hypothetical protein